MLQPVQGGRYSAFSTGLCNSKTVDFHEFLTPLTPRTGGVTLTLSKTLKGQEGLTGLNPKPYLNPKLQFLTRQNLPMILDKLNVRSAV